VYCVENPEQYVGRICKPLGAFKRRQKKPVGKRLQDEIPPHKWQTIEF
jgi:hypothetical protein